MPKHEPVVYCIGTARASYIGWTNNFPNRLRKHNGEIKGGARQTSKHANWKLHFLVAGFPTKCEALSLEKHFHLRGDKVPVAWRQTRNVFGSDPVGKRAWALYWLLQRERFSKRTKTSDMSLTVYFPRTSLLENAARDCPLPWPASVTLSAEKPLFM